MLLVYVAGPGSDFEIWGGYHSQSSCNKTMAFLERRYEQKRQAFHAVCQPVMAVQLEPMVSKH